MLFCLLFFKKENWALSVNLINSKLYSKNMKIRKAQIKDLKEIDEIYMEGQIYEEKKKVHKKNKKEILVDLNKSRKDRLNGFKETIQSPKSKILVCEENKKIIAFGNATLGNKKRGAEISLIYVRTKYHKKGIGSKILNELLKYLKREGESKVYATIDDTNKASIKLNKKAGFKRVAIFMEKKL